jgi:hypothetical protein
VTTIFQEETVKNFQFNTFLLFGLLLVCCSCGSTKGYKGPNDTGVETAQVKAHGVEFQRVNGIEVGINSSGLEILAGKNEIELTINASNYNDRGPNPKVYKIVMNAEPGMKYAVTGRRGSGKLCAFPLNDAGDPDFSAPAGCIQP